MTSNSELLMSLMSAAYSANEWLQNVDVQGKDYQNDSIFVHIKDSNRN